MNAKIEAAMKLLRKQGHMVRGYPHMGEEWFEIVDYCVTEFGKEPCHGKR